jgi:DNA-binding transcriptional ArsR family regulator
MNMNNSKVQKMENPSNLSSEITELHAAICSALADPRRILILYALSERNLNVTELAQEIGMSQPAASRHLKILRAQGLVAAARQGASVEYSLADPRLIEALDLLRNVLRSRLTYRASLIEEDTPT